MKSSPRGSASRRRHIVLTVPLALLALTLSCLGLFTWKAYRTERQYLHPPRATMPTPAIADLRTVRIERHNGKHLSGWYIPSRNRSAVLTTHGSLGSRADLVDLIGVLGAAGFGVLALDWPGHGESDGPVLWGEDQREAMREGLDWLSGRSEVDPERLGGLGFSYGGYILTQLAAEEPRLKALALLGTPTSDEELTRMQSSGTMPLSGEIVVLIDRVLLGPDDHKARDLIGKIAPRPVLLVHGASDPIVPLSMARELFAQAKEPKEIFVVPRGVHGSYVEYGGEEFSAKLVTFFGGLGGRAP